MTEEEKLVAGFDAGVLSQLTEDYTFYQYTRDGVKLQGQYFAVPNDQEPVASGDGFTFEAVIKTVNQPNSHVRSGKVTDEEINGAVQVRGANAAQTVSKTHPNLIRFLELQ